MSTTVKTGWLKDKNGDKFSPRTLTSQVQTSDGTPLEDKIANDISEVAEKIVQSNWDQNDETQFDYIHNKTHYDTRQISSFDYTYDGNSNGKEIIVFGENDYLVKISNDFPDLSSLQTITVTFSSPSGSWEDETDETIYVADTDELIVPIIDDFLYSIYFDGVYVAYVAQDIDVEGMPAFTKGLWFSYLSSEDVYVSKYSITYTSGELKKIDNKYLHIATDEDAMDLLFELGAITPVTMSDGSIAISNEGEIYIL